MNPVNDAPMAADDAVTLTEDDTVLISVLANDSDVDGDVLSILPGPFVSSGQGSVSVEGLRLRYDPGFAYQGLHDGESAEVTLTYGVSDGNGGSDTATVAVTVTGFNDAPVGTEDSFTTVSDQALTIDAASLLANDSDFEGDALSVIALINVANGTLAGPLDAMVFTPGPGFVGTAGFDYVLADSFGANTNVHVTITVDPSNLPPIADAARTATTLTDTALVFDIIASDPDGDVLSFSASDPANGTVILDGNRVTYARSDSSTGTDTVTITIDDGNGGTTTQEITLTTQNLPLSDQFVMFTADGFTGGAGGRGTAFGTDAFQQIAVIDTPGSIALDPSFNKGGDVLKLAGDASDWNITRSGSSALFSDGDTFVTVPIGTAGLAVQFDDGVRELIFDGSTFTIGGQAFASGTLSQIDAASDGTSLPPGGDPAAKAVLFIAADAEIAASGVVDIFGAAGNELASLISGNLTLDASFNRGGDTIAFDEAATNFFANQSGSSVRVTGSDTTALIPVGTSGATLSFTGGDDRIVLFDTNIPGITIAGQLIENDPVQLMSL